ncbi:hypothetical protein [Streptomyces sp. SudanB182_2057]|uniref:hypothetical protein n=1 Tax=Streptomyces sp. SudanB182_2057 TaxID=3035281 RepID=UPI003F5608E3
MTERGNSIRLPFQQAGTYFTARGGCARHLASAGERPLRGLVNSPSGGLDADRNFGNSTQSRGAVSNASEEAA